MSRQRTLRAGLVAGAAGTLALEAATYLDMAVTGRPRSDIPDQAAGQLARALHLDLTPGGRPPPRTAAPALGPCWDMRPGPAWRSCTRCSVVAPVLSRHRLPASR